MIQFPEDFKQDIWDWLEKPLTFPELIEGIQILLKEYQQYLNVEDIQKFLEELLERYDAELRKGVLTDAPDMIKEEILKWLKNNLNADAISGQPSEMRSQFFSLEEMQKRLEELMQQQDEEHNFGDHWVGTRGASPFGNSGENSMGMRIGDLQVCELLYKLPRKEFLRTIEKI